LRDALWNLEDSVGRWMDLSSPASLEEVRVKIAQVWLQMEASVQEVNPGFEAQAELFRSQGYDVIPVPVYPGGSGGLHCMVLQ
jgi:hypothetical protein